MSYDVGGLISVGTLAGIDVNISLQQLAMAADTPLVVATLVRIFATKRAESPHLPEVKRSWNWGSS